MNENITVEVDHGIAFIQTTGTVALWAGDSGTTVTVTADLTKPELRSHIATLIKAYRAL